MTQAIADLAERARRRRQLPRPAIRRAIRIDADVTQSECAEACGVSRQTFIFWEAGRRTPRGRHVEDYLELLDALRQGAGGGGPHAAA